MEEKKKNGPAFGSMVFVGCLFIGGGIGLLIDKVAVGGAIGMGIGFIAMGAISAYYNKN